MTSDVAWPKAFEGGFVEGSEAIREFIDREQPLYFFCGHIHEAAGQQATLGRTQAWNVGKRGHLLELTPLLK